MENDGTSGQNYNTKDERNTAPQTWKLYIINSVFLKKTYLFLHASIENPEMENGL